MEFTFYSFSSLIAFVFALFCGIIVWLSNTKSPVNRIYLWLSITIFIWVSGCFLESTFLDQTLNIYIDIYLYVGASFAPSAFLHSILSVLDKLKEKKIHIYFAYLISTFFLFLNLFFRENFIPEVNHRLTFRFIAQPGPLWYLFLLFFSIATIYGLLQLYISTTKEKNYIKRTQLQYLSFAYTIVVVAAFFYLLLVHNIETPPIDNLLVVIYSWVMLYAFTKSRLMDTQLLIRKTVSYLITLVTLVAIYFSSIYLTRYIAEVFLIKDNIFLLLPVLVFISIILFPVSESIKNFVDRKFFKTIYEADKIAHKFSENIKRLMKVKELAEYITRSVMQTFLLKGAACFVYDENEGEYICKDARGDLRHWLNKKITTDDILVKELISTRKALGHNEINFGIKSENISADEKHRYELLLKRLDEFNAQLVIPSISLQKEYKLIAFLILAEKKSEDPFTERDINLLVGLSHQVTIAFENSFLYEEQLEVMRKSMHLEKLVELGKATASLAKEAEKSFKYIQEFAEELPKRIEDKNFLKEEGEKLYIESEKIFLMMMGILEFSKPGILDIQPIKVKEVWQYVSVLVKEALQRNSIEVIISCNDDVTVMADKNALRQIMLNLVSNAIESMTGKGGGKLEIRITEEDEFVLITISDTGVGIPENIRDKIFEPYFTTKPEGVGLGLAIVDNLVKQLNGTITFQSQENVGTTFCIRLPRAAKIVKHLRDCIIT